MNNLHKYSTQWTINHHLKIIIHFEIFLHVYMHRNFAYAPNYIKSLKIETLQFLISLNSSKVVYLSLLKNSDPSNSSKLKVHTTIITKNSEKRESSWKAYGY